MRSLMQPPVCRVCGVAHWSREPHRFKGGDREIVVPAGAREVRLPRASAGEGITVTNDGDKPIKVLPSGQDVVVGPKQMGDEELKPYYLEWMRRAMARRRGNKM